MLLRRGAREVVAVDVGYGQLVWRCGPTSGSSCTTGRTSAHLTPEAIGGPVDLVVADLSFISLSLVLPALTACAGRSRPGADGQTAVRGRQGAARRRRRGPRSGSRGGGGDRGRAAGLLGWGWRALSPPRYPDRAAMWSSSCTFDATHRPMTLGPGDTARQLIALAVGQGPV